jgi:hypothetical protein
VAKQILDSKGMTQEEKDKKMRALQEEFSEKTQRLFDGGVLSIRKLENR